MAQEDGGNDAPRVRIDGKGRGDSIRPENSEGVGYCWIHNQFNKGIAMLGLQGDWSHQD